MQLLHYFHSVFTVFYYRSRNPQSLLVTSPTLLCCFGTVFQVTFISHTTIIPCILLHFGNCPAAWIITEDGLEMDVPPNCACLPWISPGACQPMPSSRCLQDWPGWAHWGAHCYLYNSHQSQGHTSSKPCPVPWGCCPISPCILLSPLNPASCTVCQLKDQSAEVPPSPSLPIQISDTLGLKHTQCTVNHS